MTSLETPVVPRAILRFVRTLRGIAAGLVLFATLMLANALQTASLIVFPFSRRLFRFVNRTIANAWWGLGVVCGEKLFGIRTEVTGDRLPEKESAILVANHQDMTDILVLMTLAWRKKRLGDLKWFVKDPLKYVPGIGWGMLFLDCLFLKRNWESDKDRIEKTFGKFAREKIPVWLISFSEGTRITPEKLARSQAFARSSGLFPTQHVMIPRTKGFVASVQGLKGAVDCVYDVTIGYPEGKPTLGRVLMGQVNEFKVHVKRTPLAELPGNAEDLASWLIARFKAKDDLLNYFNEYGRFPGKSVD